MEQQKKYVLIILDGAADCYRNDNGHSPLGLATIPYMDRIAALGYSGRMQTLFPGLPMESLVAQLGMFGWDPYVYYPLGRASAELLATSGIHLGEEDLAFRANFITLKDKVLASYNADYIRSDASIPLVSKINATLEKDFSDIRLYHNSDFRNTLVVKGAGIAPEEIVCIEPHENVNKPVQIEKLVTGRNTESRAFVDRINEYLYKVHAILEVESANALMPWSISKPFRLPSFSENTGFAGKTGIVGAMDFLHGIAIAGDMDFFKVGNGSPETDFAGKGECVIGLLEQDYDLVICHINAPDEASHMQLLDLKVSSLEKIDECIVQPVYRYFSQHLLELGGVMIIPDHYTNLYAGETGTKRITAHSMEPVPFVVWNNCDRDAVVNFTEDAAMAGKYGREPISSLSLIKLLTINA